MRALQTGSGLRARLHAVAVCTRKTRFCLRKFLDYAGDAVADSREREKSARDTLGVRQCLWLLL